MRVRVQTRDFFLAVNPRIVALITSEDSSGRPNAMAATWHCPISFDPPLYGVSISPARYSHDSVRDAGVFGVNFLPYELAHSVHACGRISMARRRDKLELAGVSIVKGPNGVPIVEDSYVALECKLIDHRTYGDHTWFVGQVLSVTAKPRALSPDSRVDLGSVRPLLYLGSDGYLTVNPDSVVRVKPPV